MFVVPVKSYRNSVSLSFLNQEKALDKYFPGKFSLWEAHINQFEFECGINYVFLSIKRNHWIILPREGSVPCSETHGKSSHRKERLPQGGAVIKSAVTISS